MRVLAQFYQDVRGVSFQIGNILALVILTVLLAGVIASTGSFVQDTRTDAAQEELTITGERVTAELMIADNLVQSGDRSTVTIEPFTPTRISGSQYNIELASDPDTNQGTVTLTISRPDVTVVVPFRHDTPIENTTVSSGQFEITTTESGELTLADSR